jgi:hypothetical protein
VGRPDDGNEALVGGWASTRTCPHEESTQPCEGCDLVNDGSAHPWERETNGLDGWVPIKAQGCTTKKETWKRREKEELCGSEAGLDEEG